MWYGLQCRVVKSQKNNWNFVGHKNLNQKIVQSQNCLKFLKRFCDFTISWLGSLCNHKKLYQNFVGSQKPKWLRNQTLIWGVPPRGKLSPIFPIHFWIAMIFLRFWCFWQKYCSYRGWGTVLMFCTFTAMSSICKTCQLDSNYFQWDLSKRSNYPTTRLRSCLWPSTKPVKHSTNTCTNRANASTKDMNTQRHNSRRACNEQVLRRPYKVHGGFS